MTTYNETKKYLVKSANALWEITSPHVLYLSEEQGKAYSSNKSVSDYNSFHDETLEIIKDNKKEIVSYFGSCLTLIDLGPEYPDKTLPLMQEMQLQGKSIDYVPVDINADYVRIATEAAAPFAQRVFGLRCLFDETAQNIPQVVHKEKFSFIGLTFMNFNSEKVIEMMKKIVGDGGTIGIAAELITDQNTISDIEHRYRNAKVEEFVSGPIKNLGIDPSMTEYDVRFQNRRIELGFIFKASVPDLSIESGDRIIVAVSYRYNMDELKAILKIANPVSHVWTSKSGKAAFALSR